MKVLHIASLRQASSNSGVVQQMEWEQLAAHKAGLPWSVELWTIEAPQAGSILHQVPRAMRGFIGRRLHLHLRLRSVAREYDQIIIRHAPLDLFSIFLPNWVQHKSSYVFHTKTGDYLMSRGKRFGSVFAWLDRLFTRRMIKNSRGIIGVTEELVKYELNRLGDPSVKSSVYPNGIFLTDWETPIADRREGALKVVFIASHFFEWNGLETLLDSIVNTPTDTAWELHLVGRLMPQQLSIISRHSLTDRIFVHGVLDETRIADLMSSMDLSLGAFALDKIKLRTACTLKVRESLGAGVAVYAGHIDVGVMNFPNCYSVGPADWTTILAKAAESRQREKAEIRRAARPRIDKVELLKALYHRFLDSEHRQSSLNTKKKNSREADIDTC
ncbi:MAG: hypothetical protein ACSHWZ_18735 [Sulfitobacter sp.]|uniref:hypothetical protein n=1 Tax=Celeribacter marinus TaxID=1397108 RepID=UPI0031804790